MCMILAEKFGKKNPQVIAFTGDFNFFPELWFDQSSQVSVSRSPIRITEDQKHFREMKNRSRRVVYKGKRKPEQAVAKTDGRYKVVTILRAEIASDNYFHHDSHGKHGRKPVYKQFPHMR